MNMLTRASHFMQGYIPQKETVLKYKERASEFIGDVKRDLSGTFNRYIPRIETVTVSTATSAVIAAQVISSVKQENMNLVKIGLVAGAAVIGAGVMTEAFLDRKDRNTLETSLKRWAGEDGAKQAAIGPILDCYDHKRQEIGGCLTFDGINVTDLPAEIELLTHVQFLQLIQMQLKDSDIPASIGRLTNLKALDFSANQLSTIPVKMIGQPKNLTYLSLSQNQLIELPEELKQLENLQYLYLSKNDLTEASLQQLKGFKNLKIVDLTGNSQLSDAAIEQLKQALPGVDIKFGNSIAH